MDIAALGTRIRTIFKSMQKGNIKVMMLNAFDSIVDRCLLHRPELKEAPGPVQSTRYCLKRHSPTIKYSLESHANLNDSPDPTMKYRKSTNRNTSLFPTKLRVRSTVSRPIKYRSNPPASPAQGSWLAIDPKVTHRRAK